VSYGPEKWALMKKEEKALLIFKGTFLEEYIVLIMKTGNGVSRKNRELNEMSKVENIVKWIKE